MRGETFCREADFWTLSFEGRVVRVKDSKGMGYIARLVSEQGAEIHALDLASPDHGRMNMSARDDVLDGSARASFRRRVQELEVDIEDAEEIGDIAAAERARDERDAIVSELTAAYGLGGRPRTMSGDPSERARKAVTERIRTTISRIETVHPALGKHLRRFVRTGTFCSYAPETRVDWVMEAGPASRPQTKRGVAIRVIVVDDHPLWRKTLRQVLEHDGLTTIVAEASDGREALEIASRLRPDVVLMDLDLPEMRGIDATRALIDVWPQAKVLVLSSCDERAEVIEAVSAGADGYILKTADAADIIDAVRRIHGGELVFPPPVSRMVLSELRQRP